MKYNLLVKGWTLFCLQDCANSSNVVAEIEVHQTRQHFYNLLLPSFLLLQGSMYCVFRNAPLHPLITTSGYYC